MISNLLIYHKASSKAFEWPCYAQPSVEWSTCLRQIRISQAPSPWSVDSSVDCFQGVEGYQFLLEVVCGLHSPVWGETEVHGQFKQLLLGYQEENGLKKSDDLGRLLHSIHCDAKYIRAHYLSGLGRPSYGSFLRKRAREMNGDIHFLGAGQFVKDLLPWIRKMDRHIFIHCRNPEKASKTLNDFKDLVTFVPLAKHSEPLKGLLVVAAPQKGAVLSSWLQSATNLEQILDLRANSNEDPIEHPSPVEVLGDLFAEIERTRKMCEQKVAQAKIAIAKISREKIHQHSARVCV